MDHMSDDTKVYCCLYPGAENHRGSLTHTYHVFVLLWWRTPRVGDIAARCVYTQLGGTAQEIMLLDVYIVRQNSSVFMSVAAAPAAAQGQQSGRQAGRHKQSYIQR